MSVELVNYINTIFSDTQDEQNSQANGVRSQIGSIELPSDLISTAIKNVDIVNALTARSLNADIANQEVENSTINPNDINPKQKAYFLLYPFKEFFLGLDDSKRVSVLIDILDCEQNLVSLVDKFYQLKKHSLFKILELKLSAVNKDNIESWDKFLQQILLIADVINDHCQYSDADIELFSEIFYDDDVQNALRMKNTAHKLGNLAGSLDTGMNYTYLACCAFSTLLAVGSLASGNLGAAVGVLGATMGIGWNVYDGFGAIGVAADCFNRGDKKLGATNTLSGAQLLGFTAAGISISGLGMTTNLISAALASTIGGAFLGFSFAACMLIGVWNERISASRCEEAIGKIEKQLGEEQISVENRTTLEQTRLMKKAQLADHKNNEKAWWLCTVAMTAVATAGVVTAAVLTGGIAVVAVPVAMTLFATATAIARNYYFHWKTSNVEKLKKAQSNETVKKFIDLKGKSGIWGKQDKAKIISKLEKLVLENSSKAQSIVTVIDRGFFTTLEELEQSQQELKNIDENKEDKQGSALSVGQLLTTSVRKPGWCFWKKTSLSDYITEMLFKDPSKAMAILNSLKIGSQECSTESDDDHSLKGALSRHRGGKLTAWGKTTGLTLFARVNSANTLAETEAAVSLDSC